MVATSLPSKAKLAGERCVEDVEEIRTDDKKCCKRNLCWPLVKLFTYIIILAFFSLILAGQISGILYALENVESEVKISFRRPNHVTFPAVTVCNNNPIQKSKFCEKYPEHCSTNENGPAVNLSSYYRLLNNLSSIDTIPLGQSWKDFTQNCVRVHSNDNTMECKHVRKIYWSLNYQNCFTFLSGEDKLTGDYRKAAFWIVLDFQPKENIDNHSIVGGQLFIHDPDSRIPTGFPISSYTLKPGRMYRYRLRQTNIHRLPPPFESGCADYEDSQVTSQEECYNQCLYDKFMSSCDCMPDVIPFFESNHSTNYCQTENGGRDCEKSERSRIETICNDNCPIKCTERGYHVKVDEIEVPEYNSDFHNARKYLANIWIKFDSNEQKTYRETFVETNFPFLIYFAYLYSAAILLLLLLVVGTMIELGRICKSR